MSDESAKTRAGPRSWHDSPTRISLAALLVSCVSIVVTTGFSFFVYYADQRDEKTDRSIYEVNHVYSPEFMKSLTNILDVSYDFIENAAEKPESKKERFERFWQEVDNDGDMLIISSRLSSISACIDDGNCYREIVFSRFPESVYEAIYFLREFVFLDSELNAAETLDGWWLGARVQNLLANYCAWVVEKRGGMDLWSERYELIRSPADALPGPCISAIPA